MDPLSKLLCWLILLPKSIYTGAGADYVQLNKILRLKLLLDTRKPFKGPGTAYTKKSKKPGRSAGIWTLVLALFTGIFIGMFSLLGANLSTGLVFFFSLFLFFLAGMLVSDFSSILLDDRDNQILLPRPVNDATLMVVKILHILISILRLALPLSVTLLIMAGMRSNVAGALLVIPMVFSAILLAVMIVNGLYILILRYSTAKQFQSLSSWIQIFISIVLYSSFQLGSRMINYLGLRTLNYIEEDHPFLLLNPGSWFALSWHAIFYTTFGNPVFIAALFLTLVLPVAGIFLLVKNMSGGFARKLGIAGTGQPNEEVDPAITGKKRFSGQWVIRLSEWFTKKGIEREAFLLYWRITSRSREFKLKVYPSLGYLLVYAAILGFQAKDKIMQLSVEEGPGLRALVIFSVYSFSFVTMTAMGQMQFSSQYKAAYVYHISPMARQGLLHTGMYKMLVVKFLLPLLIPVMAAGVWLGGISIIPNLLFAFINLLISTAVVCYLRVRNLPFSMPYSQEMKQGGGCLFALANLFISVVMGGAHFFMFWYLPLVAVGLVLSSIGFWLIYGSLAAATFTNIGVEIEESETEGAEKKHKWWQFKKAKTAKYVMIK